MHAQFAASLAVGLQRRHDVAIDLDDVERASQCEHGGGDRAATGTDFDQPLAGARIDGANDAVDRAGVVQEVLTVALLGVTVLHQCDAWSRARRPSSSASVSAACRLPGSALRVPARSSAVP